MTLSSGRSSVGLAEGVIVAAGGGAAVGVVSELMDVEAALGVGVEVLDLKCKVSVGVLVVGGRVEVESGGVGGGRVGVAHGVRSFDSARHHPAGPAAGMGWKT